MPRPLDTPREQMRIGDARSGLPSDAKAADTITGRRCVVAFDPDHHDIRFDGVPAPTWLTLRVAGRADLAHTTAHGFAREIVADGATFAERCFVFHDLPLTVLEWTSCQPAPDALIRLEILVRTGAGPLWRTGEGAVRIDAPGRTVALVTTADARLSARQDLDAIRIDVALPAAAGPARIAVATALVEGDDLDSILDAARSVDVRVRARTASLRRRDVTSIRMDSSSPTADAALRTAVSRLDATPRFRAGEPAGHGPRGTARHGRPAPPASGYAEPAAPPWTGELERIGSTGRLALAALIAGDPAMARELTAHAGDDPDRLMARFCYAWTGDRAFLPGGSADVEPPDLADDPPPAGLAARRIVALDPLLPDSVAAPILGLALDVLGASPDAARGRLRLRPVLPEGWRTIEVTDLPMADSRISLRMARTDAGVNIRIEQTEGAVPIRAILEPVVTARALVGAVVDGQPASLVPRPLGDRIRVPVQLALDDVRRLSLHLA